MIQKSGDSPVDTENLPLFTGFYLSQVVVWAQGPSAVEVLSFMEAHRCAREELPRDSFSEVKG